MPTRVGDSYKFTVGRTSVPADQTVVAPLGSVPIGEDYLSSLTARVTWHDPVGVPFFRTLGIQIGLLAYDAAGNPLLSWDNNLRIEADQRYTTSGVDTLHDVSFIAQDIVHVPPEAAELRLEMQYPTGDATDPIVVESASAILTIVTPG